MTERPESDSFPVSTPETASAKPAPKLHLFQKPEEAWAWAKSHATPAHLIGITGSFFFAAEMRRLLRSEAQ